MYSIEELQKQIEELSKKALLLKNKADDSREAATAYKKVFELLEDKLGKLRDLKI